MYITIDELDRRPIYRQVADEIKGLMARGELREGMALPPIEIGPSSSSIDVGTEFKRPKRFAARAARP